MCYPDIPFTDFFFFPIKSMMRGKDFRISLPKAYSIEKVQTIFFQTVTMPDLNGNSITV